MRLPLTYFFVFFVLILAASCSDRKKPYNEKEDAYPLFEKSLEKTQHPKKTLVIFGANWCKYCLFLNDSLKEQPLKSFVAKHFNIIKVDVGSEDRNQKVKDFFSTPTRRGIPAIAIIDDKKNIIYQSSDGTFSDVTKASPEEVKRFLSQYAGT